ncbi:AraC family transcriptional regulator [Pseudomonas sp. DC3200b2]|uniref:AraC family transcriptional regulator n=1 Tax=Pseudomonas sp. DC3200b2 TaxID=2804669 RepID=UPI003CF6389D
MIKDSISTKLVLEALQAVPSDAAREALAAAGISAFSHGRPGAPDDRVGVAHYGRLWQAVAALTDDEFFGMGERPLRVGSLAFAWRAATAQATVGAGIGLALDFLRLMLGNFDARPDHAFDLAAITLAPVAPPTRPFTCFTFWMIVYGLACWLAGRRLPILAVELRSAAPADQADYERFFGAHLRFGQAHDRLILPGGCLGLPVRRTARDLEAFIGRLPGNLLVKYRDPAGLAHQLREQLQAAPAVAWPEASSLARDHGMSEATFRRKLAAEGQSVQRVKASVRKERAVRWLAEDRLSLAQIAEALGFADESSFYRAFRQWFGCNPGHYRNLIMGPGENAHRD